MREIKFRGKRIDIDRWVYGYYFKTPLTDENSGTDSKAGWFFLTGETRHIISNDSVAFTVIPETVGQYTGWKDMDGKELYEGDICISPYLGEQTTLGLVTFNKYCCFAFESKENPSKQVVGWQSIYQPKGLRLLGNIYSNPELVEKFHKHE